MLSHENPPKANRPPILEQPPKILDVDSDDLTSTAVMSTDPGMVTMATNVVVPANILVEHVNRFAVLAELGFGEKPPDVDENIDRPETWTTTAGAINSASFSTRNTKRRERRLKTEANMPAREAVELLAKSATGKAPEAETSQDLMDKLKASHAVQHQVAPTLRAFEKSKARVKEMRTQRLRTAQAWDKIASADRAKAKSLFGSKHLVMFWGAAGTGVGSRIKGYSRRGGEPARVAPRHPRRTRLARALDSPASATHSTHSVLHSLRQETAQAPRPLRPARDAKRANDDQNLHAMPGAPGHPEVPHSQGWKAHHASPVWRRPLPEPRLCLSARRPLDVWAGLECRPRHRPVWGQRGNVASGTATRGL